LPALASRFRRLAFIRGCDLVQARLDWRSICQRFPIWWSFWYGFLAIISLPGNSPVNPFIPVCNPCCNHLVGKPLCQ
jgi:hypothetical protein